MSRVPPSDSSTARLISLLNEQSPVLNLDHTNFVDLDTAFNRYCSIIIFLTIPTKQRPAQVTLER